MDSVGLPVCIELCIRALQMAADDGSTKATLCKTISCLLPSDLEVKRACQLTEFLIEPTVDSYYAVETLYNEPDQKLEEENMPVPNSLRCELLLVFKTQWPFDPEFWDWKTLKRNCLALMGEEASIVSSIDSLNDTEEPQEEEEDFFSQECFNNLPEHAVGGTYDLGDISDRKLKNREMKKLRDKGLVSARFRNWQAYMQYCVLCDKEFLGHRIVRHAQTHFEGGLYSCPICAQTFTSKDTLVPHVGSHVKQSCNERLTSIKTNQKLADPRSAAPVFAAYNAKRENEFKVKADSQRKNGGLVYNKSSVAQSNIETSENNVCPVGDCKRSYKFFKNLVAHVKGHGDNEEAKTFLEMQSKKVVCQYCRRHFISVTHLNDHLQVHCGAKPYICIQLNCKASFLSNTELIVHKKTHTSFRAKCMFPNCGKIFDEAFKLYDHEAQHYKTFTCRVVDCGKVFHSQQQLDVHQDEHSVKKEPPAPSPPEHIPLTKKPRPTLIEQMLAIKQEASQENWNAERAVEHKHPRPSLTLASLLKSSSPAETSAQYRVNNEQQNPPLPSSQTQSLINSVIQAVNPNLTSTHGNRESSGGPSLEYMRSPQQNQPVPSFEANIGNASHGYNKDVSQVKPQIFHSTVNPVYNSSSILPSTGQQALVCANNQTAASQLQGAVLPSMSLPLPPSVIPQPLNANRPENSVTSSTSTGAPPGQRERYHCAFETCTRHYCSYRSVAKHMKALHPDFYEQWKLNRTKIKVTYAPIKHVSPAVLPQNKQFNQGQVQGVQRQNVIRSPPYTNMGASMKYSPLHSLPTPALNQNASLLMQNVLNPIVLSQLGHDTNPTSAQPQMQGTQNWPSTPGQNQNCGSSQVYPTHMQGMPQAISANVALPLSAQSCSAIGSNMNQPEKALQPPVEKNGFQPTMPLYMDSANQVPQQTLLPESLMQSSIITSSRAPVKPESMQSLQSQFPSTSQTASDHEAKNGPVMSEDSSENSKRARRSGRTKWPAILKDGKFLCCRCFRGFDSPKSLGGHLSKRTSCKPLQESELNPALPASFLGLLNSDQSSRRPHMPYDPGNEFLEDSPQVMTNETAATNNYPDPSYPLSNLPQFENESNDDLLKQIMTDSNISELCVPTPTSKPLIQNPCGLYGAAERLPGSSVIQHTEDVQPKRLENAYSSASYPQPSIDSFVGSEISDPLLSHILSENNPSAAQGIVPTDNNEGSFGTDIQKSSAHLNQVTQPTLHESQFSLAASGTEAETQGKVMEQVIKPLVHQSQPRLPKTSGTQAEPQRRAKNQVIQPIIRDSQSSHATASGTLADLQGKTVEQLIHTLIHASQPSPTTIGTKAEIQGKAVDQVIQPLVHENLLSPATTGAQAESQGKMEQLIHSLIHASHPGPAKTSGIGSEIQRQAVDPVTQPPLHEGQLSPVTTSSTQAELQRKAMDPMMQPVVHTSQTNPAKTSGTLSEQKRKAMSQVIQPLFHEGQLSPSTASGTQAETKGKTVEQLIHTLIHQSQHNLATKGGTQAESQRKASEQLKQPLVHASQPSLATSGTQAESQRKGMDQVTQPSTHDNQLSPATAGGTHAETQRRSMEKDIKKRLREQILAGDLQRRNSVFHSSNADPNTISKSFASTCSPSNYSGLSRMSNVEETDLTNEEKMNQEKIPVIQETSGITEPLNTQNFRGFREESNMKQVVVSPSVVVANDTDLEPTQLSASQQLLMAEIQSAFERLNLVREVSDQSLASVTPTSSNTSPNHTAPANVAMHSPSSSPFLKPFVCDHCAFNTLSGDALWKHLSKAHSYTIEMVNNVKKRLGEYAPYKCEKCNKRFTRNSNLRTHYHSVHRLAAQEIEQIDLKRREARTAVVQNWRLNKNQALEAQSMKATQSMKAVRVTQTLKAAKFMRPDSSSSTMPAVPFMMPGPPTVASSSMAPASSLMALPPSSTSLTAPPTLMASPSRPEINPLKAVKREYPSQPSATFKHSEVKANFETPKKTKEKKKSNVDAKSPYKPYRCVHQGCVAAFTIQHNLILHYRAIHQSALSALEVNKDQDQDQSEEPETKMDQEGQQPEPAIPRVLEIRCQVKDCSGVFQEVPSLLQHYFLLHKLSLERVGSMLAGIKLGRFACGHQGCTVSFTSFWRYMGHVKDQHKDLKLTKPENLNNLFKCEIEGCELAYATKSNMLRHLMKKHFDFYQNKMKSQHSRENKVKPSTKTFIYQITKPSNGKENIESNKAKKILQKAKDVKRSKKAKGNHWTKYGKPTVKSKLEAAAMCTKTFPLQYPCMIKGCDTVMKSERYIVKHYLGHGLSEKYLELQRSQFIFCKKSARLKLPPIKSEDCKSENNSEVSDNETTTTETVQEVPENGCTKPLLRRRGPGRIPSTLLDSKISDIKKELVVKRKRGRPPKLGGKIAKRKNISRQVKVAVVKSKDKIPDPSPPATAREEKTQPTSSLATFKPMGFEMSFLQFLTQSKKCEIPLTRAVVDPKTCTRILTPTSKETCVKFKNRTKIKSLNKVQIVLDKAFASVSVRMLKQLQDMKPVVVLKRKV